LNEEEQIEQPIIDRNFIQQSSSNEEVIKFLKGQLKRLSTTGSINLIRGLLSNSHTIKVSNIMKKNKAFAQYNMGKLNDDEFKPEIISTLRKELITFIVSLDKDFEIDEKINEPKKYDDEPYIVTGKTAYEKLRSFICDELGNISFTYDFDNPDMEIKKPESKMNLQRCVIQISSTGIRFNYPLEYIYNCVKCFHRDRRKAYHTVSSKTKINCQGIYMYVNPQTGESKSVVCNTVLYPDDEVSITKIAYYYDVNYEDDDGNKISGGAISFKQYEPGFYDAALFALRNPKKTELFHIIDIKKEENNNELFIPQTTPNKNIIFDLIDSFDSFITENTNTKIHGLAPVKAALIIQKLFFHLGMKLFGNIQLVGDPSTGKSLILKYYGFLLNNHLNLSTNGISISIAGLRGTRHVVNLMGKDHKIVTSGHLGSYHSIHIDEAGENKELVQNLKTFLLEDNYGYDKAGTMGITNKRIAQLNLSENLDYNHVGQYRGAIRKAYKELNITVDGQEKDEWNENWDLHLPLYKYNNPHLRKVIREKRDEYRLKQVFWIDGYDYALHERFPFYFYLVTEKENPLLMEVVKENFSKNTISENVELLKALRSEQLENFFKGIKEWHKEHNNNHSTDHQAYMEIDKIISSYGLNYDSRMKAIYYQIVKASRLLNKRQQYEHEDFELIKWFIETTNRKIDVADMVGYKIEGPPDIKAEFNKNIREEESEPLEEFGIPEGLME